MEDGFSEFAHTVSTFSSVGVVSTLTLIGPNMLEIGEKLGGQSKYKSYSKGKNVGE